MSDAPFTSFGRFSRPDIGLISDSTQNLAEIFDSDKRDALRNILIRPEILDSLYKVSEEITREDLRSASGLSGLLLPSLNQLDEMANDRVPTRLFINKEFYSLDSNLGGVGSPSLNTPNVILFNGSIQCEGVQYRANTIGTTLFTNPGRVNISLSTSRASLFNAETDPVNVGYFLSAKYPGSIRVRRRSHVNRVFVPKTSFLTKPTVVENPTHSIQVNVDNGNTGTITPVKLLATKNTPLRVYCRMATGRVTFTFTDSAAPYFFGYQIQPVQQRLNSPPVEFLPVIQKSQQSGSTTFVLDIDITTTGYQNLYDLYLYLYVNPEKVAGIEFSGIDIREFIDQKDLGLIGFNNLRDFRVSGGSMTILPLWLKTLRTTLRSLNLSGSGDTWRSGPMGWFDIRDASAVPSFTHPLYTAVSYLTVPKSGVLINEDGNDWSGSSGSGETRVAGMFEKYILNQSRTAGTDYRQFTALTSLSLGDRFLGRSPRFDDVFPNLRSLSWSRTSSSSRSYRFLFGSLPKINNNGLSINYNIGGSGAVGSIVDIGTSATSSNNNHISKYKMSTFNVEGNFFIRNNISGYINNPVEDWSSWRTTATSIDYTYTGSGLSINLQSVGTWENLISLSAAFSGGAQLSSPSQSLLTPKLRSLSLYGSGTTGPMFSLGSVSDTSALESINIGSCNSISATVSNGINYLLPSNFAGSRSPGNDHKLTALYVNYFNPSYRFRTRDLDNLYNLTLLYTSYSNLTGKYPVFPLKRLFETDTKSLSIQSENSSFYDLRNLGINQSNFYFARDVRNLVVWSQNSLNGGALLPSFEGTSTSNVQVVDMSGSQPSTYRSDWSVASRRNSCVLDDDLATVVSGLSISRSVQPDSDDNIYTLTGASNFRQLVQVGDAVRLSANGSDLSRVMSVTDSGVIIDADIPDPLPTDLYFARRTNSISNWFGSGFSSLLVFRAANCKLSGTLNIRSGFSSIRDDSFPALNLSGNMISGYVSGGLSRIFSGNSRKITIDLSSNNLNTETIRGIISEVSDLDALGRFSNCRVRLSLNKLDADNRYSNYTQNEVFPVTVSSGSDIVTSLSRNELFNVFTETTITNPDGTTTTQRVQTGTRTINIPGALVSGVYYKIKTDSTQVTQENPVALRFKTLRGILVDLGFIYVSPSTTPVVTSTVYSNVTTRYQSIIDAGYNPADLVNP
jgi:hypothetical protein